MHRSWSEQHGEAIRGLRKGRGSSPPRVAASWERQWGTRHAHVSQKERDVPIKELRRKLLSGPQGRGEGLEQNAH